MHRFARARLGRAFMLVAAAAAVAAGLAQTAFAQRGNRDRFADQVIGSASSPRGLVRSIRMLSRNGGRVDWSHDGQWIAYDRRGEDGYYDVWIIRPDGRDDHCLTCDTGGVVAGGHNGQPAWHPSGRYLVFQSEKRQDVGNWGRDLAALPGAGHCSDLWVADLQTGAFHQLTHTANTDDSGVLHAHFSNDGTMLSWTDGVGAAALMDPRANAGYWRLMVAEFQAGGGAPRLVNPRAFLPGGEAFYENHGFSGDDRRLVFTSTFEMSRSDSFLESTRIFELDLATGEVVRLTDADYNETAHYTPSGRHIVWMTSRDNPTRGTDYWVMDPDGGDARRITDFNNRRLPTSRRRLLIAADHSFAPDGRRFAAYIQTNLVTQDGMTVIIELDLDRTDPL